MTRELFGPTRGLPVPDVSLRLVDVAVTSSGVPATPAAPALGEVAGASTAERQRVQSAPTPPAGLDDARGGRSLPSCPECARTTYVVAYDCDTDGWPLSFICGVCRVRIEQP